MKRLVCAVLALVATQAARADVARSSVAARRERLQLLTRTLGPSCANARVFLKLDSNGEEPACDIRYYCPNCGDYHIRSVSRNLRREEPVECTAFAVAPNRFVVQDLHLLSDWVARYELELDGKVYPAKPVLRYPANEALLLETEGPVAGMRPLTFSKRIAFADDAKGVFFYSTREAGLPVVGLKSNTASDFISYPSVRREYVKCTANAIAVNASNEAVTVCFRPQLPLGDAAFAPPAEWRSEPVEAFERRWKETEADAARGLVPIYLHLDDENNRKDGYSRRYSGYRDESESTDIDTVGLVLPDGDVVANLRLDASKVSEIDKIEAQLADGKRVPLEFAGVFADYTLVVFRFPDGKVPAGLVPQRLDVGPCVRHFGEEAFAVAAANYNGKVKVTLEYGRIKAFTFARAGETVPELPGCERGKLSLLRYQDGSFAALSSELRGVEYHDGVIVSANILGRLLSDRDFDPQFALRQGKDRIRIAWIGVETQRMTEDLAREKKATALLAAAGSGGALVTRVWPDTPSAKAGLRVGDVLLSVRLAKGHNPIDLEDGDALDGFDWSAFFESFGGEDEDEGDFSCLCCGDLSPWPNVERGVNRAFTRLGIGKEVVVAFARDGERKEAKMTLAQAPVHYQTAKRVKLKDLGIIVSDMTFEVRGYFKFEERAPGVVLAKIQPGNPAAIAGLRPLEIVTHVNDEPVASAKDFAKKVKAAKSLTFTVRRLAATRVVRIERKADVKDGP